MDGYDGILDGEEFIKEDYFVKPYDRVLGILLFGISILMLIDAYREYHILQNPELYYPHIIYRTSGLSMRLPHWHWIVLKFLSGVILCFNGIGIYLKNRIINHSLLSLSSFVFTFILLDYILTAAELKLIFLKGVYVLYPYLFLILIISFIAYIKNITKNSSMMNITFIAIGIISGIIPNIYEHYFVINEIHIGGNANSF